ncbi:hypothetical protein, partial [Sphingobacterium siyangense]|uniref:hypothetical protein n=1 Tax=Sphingobacterium siyangense TaxID=459529 RepID=UPI003C73587F
YNIFIGVPIKKDQIMKNIEKKVYISPRVETTTVELEQGIAAGSAPDTIHSTDPQESWDNVGDDNRTINW